MQSQYSERNSLSFGKYGILKGKILLLQEFYTKQKYFSLLRNVKMLHVSRNMHWLFRSIMEKESVFLEREICI